MSTQPFTIPQAFTIASVQCVPLRVPLREPFVIASATMTATQAVLVELTLDDGSRGLGEGATLPPVTDEDEAQVLQAARAWALRNQNKTFRHIEDCLEGLNALPVTRAAVECALLDALARRAGTSVRALFASPDASTEAPMESDITIPILPQSQMLSLARGWYEKGFRAFKIKVGKDMEADRAAVLGIARELPRPRFRLDANGGYTHTEASKLITSLLEDGVTLECFEQPCAREDLDGMAKLVRDHQVPIIADESLRSSDDLDELLRARAASAINLKLAKLGSFRSALDIARRARAAGVGLMIGGMVETRIGMNAAAHLGFTLGGCDYADMDTAWLLSEELFVGGYDDRGCMLHPAGNLGFGVTASPPTRARLGLD